MFTKARWVWLTSFLACCAWLGLASASLAADAKDAKWPPLVEKKLKEITPKPGAVICIGSSQMEHWKSISTDLAPLTVYNMAIGGSTMRQAAELFAAKLAIPFKPRAIILYEGSNDIAGNVTVAHFLEHFKAVHQQIHAALPNTRLYVLGIVPSPGKRFAKWETIKEANRALQAECATQPWMKFIDTTTPLIGPNGQPRPECFIPGDIHMTPEGYKVWTKVIAPVVVEAEKKFEGR